MRQAVDPSRPGGGRAAPTTAAADSPSTGEGTTSVGEAVTSGRARPWALAAVCAVLFLTFLDNTIVSVTLADVQSDLHAGVTQLQWVVDGYALVFAGLMLTAGAFSDVLGRKRVMLGGIVVFCAGSVLAALAPTTGWLIAGRVVMGAGAAASEPGTLSMIRHMYPQRGTRARALGAWAAVSGLALALGPVIGGALIEWQGWRAVFWFNLAFGAVALVAAAVTLRENADPGRRVDVPGGLLGILALTTLTYAVIQGEVDGYTNPTMIALFAVAAVAAVAFVLAERRRGDPLIDLGLFRHPAFAGSLAVAFLTYFGLFAIFFFTALYLQVVANYSGGEVARQFLPMTAVLILTAALTGRWVARSGPRLPMTLGCLLAGGGVLATDAALGPNVSYGPLAGALVAVGLGFGMVLVPVTSTPLTVAPGERSGMAASATNTSRQLGAVVGVAVLGSLVNAQLTGSLRAQLNALGIPAQFQSVALQAVTTGQANQSSLNGLSGSARQIAEKVLHAAYVAFGDGLHVCLTLAGALILVAAAISLLTMRRPKPAVS